MVSVNTFHDIIPITLFSDCLEGFLTEIGDVPGRGLTGEYSANETKCATDCNERAECGGFEYSRNLKMCKLVKEMSPTGPKYQDFLFCGKQGTYVVIIVSYSIRIPAT